MFGQDCDDDAGMDQEQAKAPGMREKLLEKLISMMMEMPEHEQKPQGVEVVSLDVDPKKQDEKLV